ncbi:hypothetical protein J4218_04775 [Candidatus Pacearchaeota archaeon]|nr:hypothetical protein [Candidatus Pacearchaeota archaeon]
MLPRNFELRWLDYGIRSLVISLNRIPGVYTMTTCEGHIWKDIPLWPTKDGWVHFGKPRGVHDGLVTEIRAFLFRPEYYFFNLGISEFPNCPNLDPTHTISASFDKHTIGAESIFLRMDLISQRNYFKRAERRKQKMLQGWNDLNQVVIGYIRKNITFDYDCLPFI